MGVTAAAGDTSRVGSEQGPPLLEFPAQRKGNRPPRAGVEDRSAQRGGKGGVLRGKRSGVGVLKFAARVYPAKSSIARVQEALRASFISPLQAFVFFEQKTDGKDVLRRSAILLALQNLGLGLVDPKELLKALDPSEAGVVSIRAFIETLAWRNLEWNSLTDLLHELYETRLRRGLVTAAAMGARSNEQKLLESSFRYEARLPRDTRISPALYDGSVMRTL
eukprot:Tamp_19526.p3 GENE.Tamp_19526~~Tamp_19526.p3  ORF type:complete len:221 (-),score=38.74 Tamp_19526:315-977(-)